MRRLTRACSVVPEAPCSREQLVTGLLTRPDAGGSDAGNDCLTVAELLCAVVPAGKFMKMGKGYKFWDHKHTVQSAQGIGDMFVQLSPSGDVPYRTYGRG